jgi:cereblon
MSSCPAPGWVIQQYDFDYLREEVMKAQQLNRLTSDEGVSCQLPLDMTSLSYWLSRRLPVDNKTKFELLSINCPTTRLLLGLKILKVI